MAAFPGRAVGGTNGATQSLSLYSAFYRRCRWKVKASSAKDGLKLVSVLNCLLAWGPGWGKGRTQYCVTQNRLFSHQPEHGRILAGIQPWPRVYTDFWSVSGYRKSITSYSAHRTCFIFFLNGLMSSTTFILLYIMFANHWHPALNVKTTCLQEPRNPPCGKFKCPCFSDMSTYEQVQRHGCWIEKILWHTVGTKSKIIFLQRCPVLSQYRKKGIVGKFIFREMQTNVNICRQVNNNRKANPCSHLHKTPKPAVTHWSANLKLSNNNFATGIYEMKLEFVLHFCVTLNILVRVMASN